MRVGSVANATAILRHLAVARPQGVNAIARELALSPSSCFNILKTLTDEGFLDFQPETKTYSIGIAAIQLFQFPSGLGAWLEWLERELHRLCLDLQLSSGLWQVRGNRVVLLKAMESSLATRIHLAAGQRLPKYLGAMGRCIAAAEDVGAGKISDIIASLRWQRAPTAEAYLRDMRAAKERGWSLDEGNYLSGVVTLAAAISNGRGHVSHCLTATSFSGQHFPGQLNEIGDRLAKLAAEASERLTVGARLP